MSRTSSPKWRRIRAAVIKRCMDEGKTRCPICGVDMDFEYPGRPNSVEIDHIVPHSMGGEDSMENVQAMCLRDNRRKGNGQARKPHPVVRVEPPTLIEW